MSKSPISISQELAGLLIERIGQDFDGECHLTEDEARKIAAFIRKQEEEIAALTKALTGLTCGGSEFFTRKGDRYVADISACVEYVKRVRSDQHTRIIEAVGKNKDQTQTISRLTSELDAAREGLSGAVEDLRRIYRGCEMSAAIMRDPLRTGGWEGSEKTARAFESYSTRAKDRHDALHALLSPPAQGANGWLPIESAPKDGTWVLVCIDRLYLINGFTPQVAYFGTYHPNTPGAECWRNSQRHVLAEPTHWRPLPDPPAQEGEG